MREVSLQVFFHHFPQGNDEFSIAEILVEYETRCRRIIAPLP
jgi:hypothetical protein